MKTLSIRTPPAEPERVGNLDAVEPAVGDPVQIGGKTIIELVTFRNTGSFQQNDLTVTVPSALGAATLGFLEPSPAGTQVCNNLPCVPANHSTLVSGMSWNPVAQQVLSLIQQAQPMP